MLERMFFWACKFRWNFDFDAQSLYEIQYLKLKRVHKCMLKYNHLEWNSNPDTKLMRRLAEATELARVLYKDHCDKHSMTVYRKYFCEGMGNDWLSVQRRQSYPRAKVIPYRQYHFYFNKAAERDRAYHQYVKHRFYTLLEKYQYYWWD
jgi:hypothetical protein